MTVTLRCEHDFWGDSSGRKLDEPLAAASGLVMCLLGFYGNAGLDNPPLQFCIARASLIICGLGTFAFHALGPEQTDAFHLNGLMFDGVSMALVTTNLFLLFLNSWMKHHVMAMALASLVYLYFWIVTNDLATYAYLASVTEVNGVPIFNFVGQYLSFILVYVYILYMVIARQPGWYSRHKPLWICLAVSLTAWVLYQFVCTFWTVLFICHTIWHVGIGYVALYLIVLGAENTYPEYVFSRDWIYLRLDLRPIPKPAPEVKKELNVDDIFVDNKNA
jgi:hypothetical protein